jgi:hypothetical protein
MASPLRVKNTAYFDIAATSTSALWGSLRRPLAEGYAPRTRPTNEPSPVLACQDPVPRSSMAQGDELGSPSGPSACAGGRWQGDPQMESLQEGQTIQFDIDQEQ